MTDNLLHRTNINLYAKDVAYLKKIYVYGWTEQVRTIIAEHIRNQKNGMAKANRHD